MDREAAFGAPAPERPPFVSERRSFLPADQVDPPPGPDDPVHVQIAWSEGELRKGVKEAGGKWRPESKTWELPLVVARDPGLEDRIVTVEGMQI